MAEMARCCQRCGMTAKKKYWNELSSAKPSFFMIMAGNFHHIMKIPEEFTHCFKGELAGGWVLRGPSGQEWRTEITVTPKNAYFTNGWYNFVRDNGIKTLDFCEFTISKPSTFDVFIFKPSCTEREGAYFATKSSLSSSSRMCSSSLHPQWGNPKVGNVEGSEDESDENVKVEEEQDDSDHAQGSHSQVHDNGKSKVHADLSYSSSDDEEDEDGQENEGEEEDEDVPSRAKQRQTICISRRRAVTAAEREHASNLAADHVKNRNTGSRKLVMIKMKQTHVYKGFNMTLEKRWALQHMCRENHEVKLRVFPELKGSWKVGCRWSPRQRQCYLKAGWPKFVFDNNLEEYDVCVFELLRKGNPRKRKNAVFHVHIFRVVKEKVPLKRSRVFVN